jgi:UDP-N-acetylglucosamine:LPS N-acetylglucosamine transferase
MKIVFFSNSSWSIYNFRKNLIKKLIKNGHQIIVLSSKDQSTIKLKKIGCRFFEIKIKNNKINIFKDLVLLFRIKKILKKIKPNFILNFTIKPLIYGTFVARLLNIKTVNMMTGLGTIFVKKTYLTLIVILLYRISFINVS